MDPLVPACGEAEVLSQAPCPARGQCGQEPAVIKENAAMQPDNRSRRHFLAGCLAALAAWFVPWRKAVPAPVPQPVILAAGPAPGCQTVTQYSYDAADRLLGVEHLPRVPAAQPILIVESDGCVTTYTYA